MRVNKSELCQILGVSAPTLAELIQRHGAAFPVLERGGRGRDWWFESEAVVAFVDARKAEREAADTERQAALRQIALPLGHNGGPAMEAGPSLRPADMLLLMMVRRIQREEAYACGRLVETSKLTNGLGKVLREWNSHLHATVRQFGRDRDLAPELVADLDRALTDCQQKFVAFMQTYDIEAGPRQSSMFDEAAE